MARFKKSQLVVIRDPSSRRRSYIPATVISNEDPYLVQYLDRHSQTQLAHIPTEHIQQFHDQSQDMPSGTLVRAPWYYHQRKAFCHPLYRAVLLQDYDKAQPSKLVRVRFEEERRETFVDVRWVVRIE